MGHFSVEISRPPGSVLSGNQQSRGHGGTTTVRRPTWSKRSKASCRRSWRVESIWFCSTFLVLTSRC